MFSEQKNLLKGCVIKSEIAKKKNLLNKETNWKKIIATHKKSTIFCVLNTCRSTWRMVLLEEEAGNLNC